MMKILLITLIIYQYLQTHFTVYHINAIALIRIFKS